MLQFNSTTPAQPSPLTQPSEFMAAAARQPLPKKKLFGLDRRIFAVVALVLLAGLSSLAVLISLRQEELGNAPVAPNAPESQPQAFIAKPATCSITFNVPAICNARCFADADCMDVNPNWRCWGPGPVDQNRCRLYTNPTSETCTPPVISVTPSPTPTATLTPTPTPTLPPGVTPTVTPTPTPTDVPPTPTEGPTPENTPTNPPGVTVNPTTPGTTTTYTIVTTVRCNDVCSRNSDCSNTSHICYNGRCRLDANPDDATCHLPSGATTMVVNELPRQPDAPRELIKSGPADWGNYLKIGLGALGAGSLLLLFL